MYVSHRDVSCAFGLRASTENVFEFGARFGFHHTKWFRSSLKSIHFVMIIALEVLDTAATAVAKRLKISGLIKARY